MRLLNEPLQMESSVTNIEGIQDSDAVANFFCLNEPPHTYKDVDSQRVILAHT